MSRIKFGVFLTIAIALLVGCIKFRINTLALEITDKELNKTIVRTTSPAGLLNLGLTYITGNDSRYVMAILIGGDVVDEYPLNPGITEEDILDLVTELAGSPNPEAVLAAVVKSVFGSIILITDTKGTTTKADDVIYIAISGIVNLTEVESNYVSGNMELKAVKVTALTDTVSIIGEFAEIKLAKVD